MVQSDGARELPDRDKLFAVTQMGRMPDMGFRGGGPGQGGPGGPGFPPPRPPFKLKPCRECGGRLHQTVFLINLLHRPCCRGLICQPRAVVAKSCPSQHVKHGGSELAK